MPNKFFEGGRNRGRRIPGATGTRTAHSGKRGSVQQRHVDDIERDPGVRHVIAKADFKRAKAGSKESRVAAKKMVTSGASVARERRRKAAQAAARLIAAVRAMERKAK